MDEVRTISFSADSRHIVTGGHKDRTARLWDASTGELKEVLRGHDESVAMAAFSPLGDRIATVEGFPSNALRLWDGKGNPFPGNARAFQWHGGRSPSVLTARESRRGGWIGPFASGTDAQANCSQAVKVTATRL